MISPLSVIVVEPGCKVKAFKKEDGSSMIRFEMAYGKAYAALSLGRSSKRQSNRAGSGTTAQRDLEGLDLLAEASGSSQETGFREGRAAHDCPS